MAEIFSSPLTLIYTVGKNLVVNGVDIFEEILQSINYYHTKEYFNFGKEIGMALSETFLKGTHTKSPLKNKK
jgi:hypothetical protein